MKFKSFKTFLIEGGRVFKGQINVGSIPQNFVQPTLKEYFIKLKELFPQHSDIFNTTNFQLLGSVGKKDTPSGDIDIAIDAKKLFGDPKALGEDAAKILPTWNLNVEEFENMAAGYEKRARSVSGKANARQKAFVVLLSKYINDNGEGLIVSEPKKAEAGALFTAFNQFDENGEQTSKHVQIDINIGNLDWLVFAYYSDRYEKPNVKGLHRTQFMLAMFSTKGYTFSHAEGVKSKETGEIVAHTSKEAIDLLNELYGTKITLELMQNFHKLFAYLTDTLTASGRTAELHAIYDTYLKIFDPYRSVDIPNELQDYWKKNKERLGLTGKNLPKDSELVKTLTPEEEKVRQEWSDQ